MFDRTDNLNTDCTYTRVLFITSSLCNCRYVITKLSNVRLLKPYFAFRDRCINSVCDYLFVIDSVARVEPITLRYLVTSGYDIIAPLLVRSGQAWSNFWGAINTSGYYARSADYMDIAYNVIR